jgi:solute carrier family 13 (sodium-dependent dicarboxylate transporter), member 2/3/5
MLRAARGRRRLLLLAVMAVTAVLSMWMVNTAAAAMMLVTLRPVLVAERDNRPIRAALLLALAFSANFGGMATPTRRARIWAWSA